MKNTHKNNTTASSTGYDNKLQEIVQHKLINLIDQYPHTKEETNHPPVTVTFPASINGDVIMADIKHIIESISNTRNRSRNETSWNCRPKRKQLTAQGLD